MATKHTITIACAYQATSRRLVREPSSRNISLKMLTGFIKPGQHYFSLAPDNVTLNCAFNLDIQCLDALRLANRLLDFNAANHRIVGTPEGVQWGEERLFLA